MTDLLTKQPAPGPSPLAVHYTDSAAVAAGQLDDRLRRTLGKAVQFLAEDPFPPQSAPLGGDLLLRRVRASQSLVVDYRTDEQHLFVEAVTRVDKDDLDLSPETAGPAEQPDVGHEAQPAEAAPPEQGADQQPSSAVHWERVTVVPFHDLGAPPVARHGGL